MNLIPKTDSEIESMRTGGAMLARILELLAGKAVEGATPKDMSTIAAEELRALGGEPAFKGYHGYPDIICISVNDQVQHSIPTNEAFERGDIVNFDFGVRYKGLITDGGVTLAIGGVRNQDDERLLEGTKAALEAAVATIKAGIRVGDISAAIEAVLQTHRLGIVRELVGHGVGRDLHEAPDIPNYGRAGTGPVLTAGLTIAVEPITTLGSPRIRMENDGWTLRTADGSRSAQFEHTLLVTETGADILTRV